MGQRFAAWAAEVATRLFGPVFALEAGRVGRRFSTFAVRWAYLLVLAGVLFVFFYAWAGRLGSSGRPASPAFLAQFSESFFWTYAVTQFLVVCALTPAFTAGVITDEKERKTLDFLLVTDLTGREIVFGKLAARLGVLLTFVLAGLPVVAFMQFFGGIDPDLLLRAVGMTLVSVLSLAGIGVAASVLMARTRDAVLLAYAVPFAYIWFLPAAAAADLTDYTGWVSDVVWVLSSGDPLNRVSIGNRHFGGGPVPTVSSQYMVFHAVVAVLGFAFAGFRLRASGMRTAAPAAKPRGIVRRSIAWVLGRRSEARRHPPVTDDPVRWREVYVEPGSGAGLLHRLFAAGVLAAIVLPFLKFLFHYLQTLQYGREYGYWYTRWEDFQDGVQLWVCWVTGVLGVLMMLRATLRGASAVAGERDRDTWTSLLATPLAVREILRGKWAGCVWQTDAMYLLGCVWAVGVLTGAVNLLALAFAGVLLGVYMHTFAWLGIRCSVTARNSRIAIVRAVPAALFLGGGFWLVFGCCLAVFSIASRGGGDGVLYPVAFVAGATPPVALGGSPAIDFEFLRDLSGRGKATFLTLVCGTVCGGVGWWLIGNYWAQESHDEFASEANRPDG